MHTLTSAGRPKSLCGVQVLAPGQLPAFAVCASSACGPRHRRLRDRGDDHRLGLTIKLTAHAVDDYRDHPGLMTHIPLGAERHAGDTLCRAMVVDNTYRLDNKAVAHAPTTIDGYRLPTPARKARSAFLMALTNVC